MPPSSPEVAGHHLSSPRSSPADPFSTNPKAGPSSTPSIHTRSAGSKRRQQPVAQFLFPKSGHKSHVKDPHSRSTAAAKDGSFSASKRSSSSSRSEADVTHAHEAPLPHPPRRYTTADVRGILSTAYPGRARQVDELLGLIGEPGDPTAPILVYGGAATGKTTLVRDTMRLLARPHAFVSCRSSYNARLLFESVLNQLLGHVRCSANGFASAKRCDKISDFVAELPSACAVAIARNRRPSSGPANAAPALPPALPAPDSTSGNGSDDPVAATATTSSRPSSPPVAAADAPSPSLSLDFDDQGSRPPENSSGDAEGDPPLTQHSSADAPTATSSNPPLSSVTAADHYSANVRGSSASTAGSLSACDSKKHPSHMPSPPQCESVFLVFDNVEVLRNWTNGHEVISALLRLSELGRLPMLGVILISKVGWDSFRSCTGARDPLPVYFPDYNDDELCQILLQRHNHSSLYSSFLRVLKAEERQELAIKEKRMRGPSAFPLERLLAIFKCIVEMNLDQNSVWGRENLSGLARGGCPEGRLSDGGMELSADVFMQISTLVATNLLSKSGSDPLDSRANYRCNIDEDLIEKVAMDVKFPLHRYLFYG
ncbi:hypothetical protein CBR_g58810 [Chara braunii]|uniref:Uncharacterized protein n=1 Tax=Chara braunii TaxID=69332 RepID=A0A388K8H4_CHABU|nr:hypothetical protein CBR_g58810 [Chara braunii]|eukprot:GBG66319.1 hypothetical protein CBR_g58810 [Chara braunii]